MCPSVSPVLRAPVGPVSSPVLWSQEELSFQSVSAFYELLGRSDDLQAPYKRNRKLLLIFYTLYEIHSFIQEISND